MESEVKEFCFEIITKNRIFQLAAKSKNDMMEWIKVLKLLLFIIEYYNKKLVLIPYYTLKMN